MMFGFFTDLGTILAIIYAFILIIGFIICPGAFAIYFYKNKNTNWNKKSKWLMWTVIACAIAAIGLMVCVIMGHSEFSNKDYKTDETALIATCVYYWINLILSILLFIFSYKKAKLSKKENQEAIEKKISDEKLILERSISKMKDHTIKWENYITRHFSTHSAIDEHLRQKYLNMLSQLLSDQKITREEYDIEHQRLLDIN